MVKTPCLHCKGTGSILGQDTKRSHMSQSAAKKKKKRVGGGVVRKPSTSRAVNTLNNLCTRHGTSGPASL